MEMKGVKEQVREIREKTLRDLIARRDLLNVSIEGLQKELEGRT